MICNIILVSSIPHSDSVFLQIIFCYRLLQSTGHNSLVYTVNPCWSPPLEMNSYFLALSHVELTPLFLIGASLVAQMVKNLPAMQETWVQSIPVLRRSPGEGNDNPLQYPCWESSIDWGAWPAVAWDWKKSDTTEQLTLSLSSLSFSCSVVSNSLWPQEMQDAKLPHVTPSPELS